MMFRWLLSCLPLIEMNGQEGWNVLLLLRLVLEDARRLLSVEVNEGSAKANTRLEIEGKRDPLDHGETQMKLVMINTREARMGFFDNFICLEILELQQEYVRIPCYYPDTKEGRRLGCRSRK
jgi:hypothetical protein